MDHDPKAYLYDIRKACEDMLEFTEGMTFSQYEKSKIVKAAVERKFLVIGEALAKIRREAPELLSGISNHEEIIGFRNVLVHGYDIIEDNIVWSAITDGIPILFREIN